VARLSHVHRGTARDAVASTRPPGHVTLRRERRARLTGGRTERSAMPAATTQGVTERQTGDAGVDRLGGHPLQLWGWGAVKASGPWTAHRLRVTRGEELVGAAQVLVRRLPEI